MSRDDGFDVADVASGLLDDPKVRALWRALGDQGRMGQAVTLYLATVLGSWRCGSRVAVTEAVPLWLEADAELVAALVRVRLLDKAGRIPTRSWNGWFGPAWERREARRRSGALGGLRARGKRSDSDAIAELQRRYSDATPDRPSGRSVRPSARKRAPARETASSNDATGMLRAALVARGLDVVP